MAEHVLRQTMVVKIGGARLEDALLEQMQEVVIHRRLNETGSCRIRFYDPSLAHQDLATFTIGKPVSVDVGDEKTTQVFAGEITSVSQEASDDFVASFVIEAHDRSHRLNRVNAPQVWENSTATDVLKQLIGDAGLTAKLPPSMGTNRPYQLTVSNTFDTIDDLCRRFGCVWFVDDATFHVKKRDESVKKIDVEWGNDLIRFDVRVSAMGAVSEINTISWDSAQQERIVGKAKTSKRNVAIGFDLARSDGLGNGTWTSTGEAVGSTGLATDQTEANSIADAEFALAAAHRVRGRGSLNETAEVPVLGDWITVKNMGTQWNGDYQLSGLEYRYNPSAFRINFTVGSPVDVHIGDLVTGGRPTTRGHHGMATIGIVTNNKTPPEYSGEMRVRVKLPTISGDTLESNWARVVGLGAGKKRGQLVVPEINDEVAVVFEDGDLHRPIVLGGLWSAKNTIAESPATVVADGKVQRREDRSREGHFIAFTDTGDDESGIVIESAEKMQLVMKKEELIIDSSKQKITILGANKAQIVMDKDGNIELSGEKVTVKAKGDISMTSNAKVSVTAKNDATIDAQKATVTGKSEVSLNVLPSSVKVSGASVDVN